VLLDKDLWQTLEDQEKIRLEGTLDTLKELLINELNIQQYSSALKLAQASCIPVKTKKAQREAELLTTKELMEEWYRLNLNFRSHKQLKSSLNLVGIDVDSVDKKVLKKLKRTPIIDCLLERSEATKRIDTYGSGVFDFIHPITGRIHTEFLNNGTATGRLSSGNPINLQNIPNAKGYRESFISSPEYDWLSLDYSQQEFRLTGAISGEQKIIDAYLAGMDMHTATASLIYNKPLQDIDKKERFIGKTANFTIIYGGTEWALGKNLGLDADTSIKILKAFHEGYKTLSKFKECAEDRIIERGYSTTVLGRRRYNPPKPTYLTNYEYLKYISKIKREGFNHIIQGTAADITKMAMINIYEKNPFGDKLRMLIQVHDEINLEAHKSISKDAVEFVRTEMLNAEQPFLGIIPAAADSMPLNNHWTH
jgi:DNA polymerase I-like protein with 3'-5' exonuclease and polymerase domains